MKKRLSPLVLILFLFTISCVSKNEYISKIDLLCANFDSNKNLSITEFQTGIGNGKNDIIVTSGKVIFSKDDRTTQKIEESSFAHYNYETNIYYKNEKPVKAVITIRSNPETSIEKLDYETIYYYKNKKCLQRINEKTRIYEL